MLHCVVLRLIAEGRTSSCVQQDTKELRVPKSYGVPKSDFPGVKTRGDKGGGEEGKKIVAENGPFGTQKSHWKSLWVPFLRPFPGNEAHHFFWGPKMGFLGGWAKKYMLKKFTCFCVPLYDLGALYPDLPFLNVYVKTKEGNHPKQTGFSTPLNLINPWGKTAKTLRTPRNPRGPGDWKILSRPSG